MKYYISALKQYANFSGRSTRSEYWYFVLFNFIFFIAISMLDTAFGTRIDYESSYHGAYGYTQSSVHIGFLSLAYALAVFLPGLAVFVRRMHDVGKSGWYILLAFLPLIGFIWLLVLLCTDSQPGENKYGPNSFGIGNQSVEQIGEYLNKQ